MKKNYISPSIETIKLEQAQMLLSASKRTVRDVDSQTSEDEEFLWDPEGLDDDMGDY